MYATVSVRVLLVLVHIVECVEKNLVTKALCVSSFNDVDGLDRLLTPEVEDMFDNIYVVEGRYEGYPVIDGYDPYYIVDRFADSTINFKVMDGYKQIEKRNEYFKLAADYDFALVVDSDEWVEINQTVFDSELERLQSSKDRCFPIELINLGQRMFGPRLFRKPMGLHYRQSADPKTISHGQIWDENGNEVVRGIWNFHGIRKGEYVKGMRMYHDKEKRSMERLINDLKYQQTVLNR